MQSIPTSASKQAGEKKPVVSTCTHSTQLKVSKACANNNGSLENTDWKSAKDALASIEKNTRTMVNVTLHSSEAVSTCDSQTYIATTAGSTLRVTARPTIRMPLPTYCIPSFQSDSIRQTHSVYSPYRQRVVIKPLNSDCGCMLRYFPNVNSLPMSFGKTSTTNSIPCNNAISGPVEKKSVTRSTDKGVQTVKNQNDSCVRLKYIIARQRKLISQLVKIIVKDKLEKDSQQDSVCSLGDVADGVKCGVLSSPSLAREASTLNMQKYGNCSTGKSSSCSSKTTESTSAYKSSASRNQVPLTNGQHQRCSNSIDMPQPTMDIDSCVKSSNFATHSAVLQENENYRTKDLITDEKLLQLGRRTLELLSPGGRVLFNAIRKQFCSSLESIWGEFGLSETQEDNRNPNKNESVCVPTKKRCCSAVNDPAVKVSADIAGCHSDSEIAVANDVDCVIQETVSSYSQNLTTELEAVTSVIPDCSNKTRADCVQLLASKKKRSKMTKNVVSSDEGSNTDDEIRFRRSPRKRAKTCDTNSYIRRSASKQATKKIYDILRESDSDLSSPSKPAANTDHAKRKTRRKLLPPKIDKSFDAIVNSENIEKWLQDPIIIKEEQDEPRHNDDIDAQTTSSLALSETPIKTVAKDRVNNTETLVRDVPNHSKSASPALSTAKTPHWSCSSDSGSSVNVTETTSMKASRTSLPELRIKLEKVDAPYFSNTHDDEMTQSQALDLRVRKPLNIEESKTSTSQHSPVEKYMLLDDSNWDFTIDSPKNTAFPIMNDWPSCMSNHPCCSDASKCKKLLYHVDEEQRHNLQKWLNYRTSSNSDRVCITLQTKTAPIVVSSAQDDKTTPSRNITQCSSARKRKRKQGISCGVSPAIRDIEIVALSNSEGNDESSDTSSLEEKAKKLKKRRDYRNSRLRKTTNKFVIDQLSYSQFPFVLMSSDGTDSSEMEGLVEKCSSINEIIKNPISDYGLESSDSDKESSTQQGDSGVVSQYSTSDKNHDDALYADLPIPEKSISELELAITKIREQIERVSRKREERLLEGLPAGNYERPRDLLFSKMFQGIADQEVADKTMVKQRGKVSVKVEQDNTGSFVGWHEYEQEKNKLDNVNGLVGPSDMTTVKRHGTAASLHKRNGEEEPDGKQAEVSKKDVNVQLDRLTAIYVEDLEAAVKKESDAVRESKVAEWTMLPRKACKEAKEKISLLVNSTQCKKQKKSTRTNNGNSRTVTKSST